ncbi:MAG: hypothetical protein MUE40_20865, partial [Anaerolineae bacterium]|nr:hypothetical protein [Anaerolineae bacterium]
VGAVYQMTNVYSFEAMNGYGYPSSLLTHLLTGIFAGVVLALVNVLLLGLANGMLLLFLNRLLFKEYWPDLSLPQYKTLITGLVLLFTLVAGAVVTGFIGAPLAAILAARAARQYANWLYYADKAKRKHAEAV